MSRELVPVGDDLELHLLDRATGETIALTEAPDDLLCEALAEIDDRRRELADARRLIGDEVIARMDRQASWTMTAGGRKITAPSSAPEVEWDAEMLHGVLNALVVDKVITMDAALRACEMRVEYRPLARGLAALEKIPTAAERIALCRTSTPRASRSVRVGR